MSSDLTDEGTAPPQIISDKEVFTKGTRSVSEIAFLKGASVATIEKVMTQYPLPPKKGAKKEEKKAQPVVAEPKVIPPQSID